MKFAPAFITLIWVAFVINAVTPWEFNGFGLRPREAFGLIGVATTPFLHADLPHIISNTIGLVILLLILTTVHPKKKEEAILGIIVAGGLLYWAIGPGDIVLVGASGVVFGLITFIVVIGFRERNPLAIIASVLVAMFYGGTLLTGVLPGYAPPHVSWLGHLCGAIAGAAIAIKYPLDQDLISFDRETHQD